MNFSERAIMVFVLQTICGVLINPLFLLGAFAVLVIVLHRVLRPVYVKLRLRYHIWKYCK